MHLLTVVVAKISLGLSFIYGVVKFFDLIGSRLNEDTNLAVAVWILDASVAKPIRRWPSSSLALFHAVYGPRHFTWRCFSRSALISVITAVGAILTSVALLGPISRWLQLDSANPHLALELWTAFYPLTIYLAVQWSVCDYIVLVGTRLFVRWMARTNSMFLWLILMALNAGVSVFLSLLTVTAMGVLLYFLAQFFAVFLWVISPFILFGAYRPPEIGIPLMLIVPTSVLVPVLFTSIWLLLYAISGGLLRLATRVDVISEWLKRHLDIEKRPVQSIGFVAGILVALVYWCAIALRSLA
jgi:hypothetical protein